MTEAKLDFQGLYDTEDENYKRDFLLRFRTHLELRNFLTRRDEILGLVQKFGAVRYDKLKNHFQFKIPDSEVLMLVTIMVESKDLEFLPDHNLLILPSNRDGSLK